MAGHHPARARGPSFSDPGKEPERTEGRPAQSEGPSLTLAGHQKPLCPPKTVSPIKFKRSETASFRVAPDDQRAAGLQSER